MPSRGALAMGNQPSFVGDVGVVALIVIRGLPFPARLQHNMFVLSATNAVGVNHLTIGQRDRRQIEITKDAATRWCDLWLAALLAHLITL